MTKYLLALLLLSNIAFSSEKREAIDFFKEISSLLAKVIESDKTAFSNIYSEEILRLMRGGVKVSTGKDLKVKIGGLVSDKEFINYPNRNPMEIVIDLKDWKRISKSGEVFCIVLHEYLYLMELENYHYEATSSDLCSKLNYSIKNKIIGNLDPNQANINQLMHIAQNASVEKLTGNPRHKYAGFYIGSEESPNEYLAFDNNFELAGLRSASLCYKDLCNSWSETQCSSPKSFAEKNMFCPVAPKTLELDKSECESFGLVDSCKTHNLSCENSALLRVLVYYACIGPRSITQIN